MTVRSTSDKKTSRPRPQSDSGKIGIQPKKPLIGEPPRPIRQMPANNQSVRSGCVIPLGEMYRGKQGLDYVPAVSAENVGSTGIWFGMITIPPGGRTVAHFHEGHETALFVMSGDEVEVYSGEQLEVRETCRAGDYLYIPPGLPHVAVNRTDKPARVIAARTDPNEQESVILRPDLDAKVP